MSDEDALLKAIIAHADEDTPRLAYADWLDEHGDPERAAFIRVQCRLAEMPPNHPEWCELREQQDDLLPHICHRPAPWGKTPKQFYFRTTFLESFEDPFQRGFPHSIGCRTSDNWTPKKSTPPPTHSHDSCAQRHSVGAALAECRCLVCASYSLLRS